MIIYRKSRTIGNGYYDNPYDNPYDGYFLGSFRLYYIQPISFTTDNYLMMYENICINRMWGTLTEANLR